MRGGLVATLVQELWRRLVILYKACVGVVAKLRAAVQNRCKVS